MTKNEQDWIDSASYIKLLNHWRFAPAGDPFFQGDTGDYYKKVMFQKKAELSHSEQVRASKLVGWEK